MDDVEVLESERRHLLALGYRMLGTVADAEDAVQETYVRWYRLSEAERAEVRNPAAWLTRVAGRVCLDMLGSARARRERYVGEWLPEPVPGESPIAASVPLDPLDRATLDDSVSTALLVVLESLTPAERVAFVLHDVFGVPFAEIAETVGRTPDAARRLASQARRRVRERRAGAASRAEHDAVARAFATATATGDLSALVAVLDPDVVLRAEVGAGVGRIVRGAAEVAGQALFWARTAGRRVEPRIVLVNGAVGVLGVRDGRPSSLLGFTIADGRIAAMDILDDGDRLAGMGLGALV